MKNVKKCWTLLRMTNRQEKMALPLNFIIFPRDVPVGHRRGNNPVEYVFIFIFLPRSRKKQCLILIEV